jgi:predicted O-methyltransferase YrrM
VSVGVSTNKLVQKGREVLEHEGLGSFAYKTVRYPFRPLLIPRAARRLRAAAAQAGSLDSLIQLSKTFNSDGITIEPWQVDSEIRALLTDMQPRRPKVLVEIGTASGGTLFLLAQTAAPGALLISIDLSRAMFGGGYARWRAPLYRSFAGQEQRIELIRGDSHDSATFERVVELLDGSAVDVLFIDGDHRYEGVKADFDRYGKLVAPDGIVAFHDIVPGETEFVGGVPDFWQEVKEGRDTRELVDDWDRGSCGIGVIYGREGSDDRVGAQTENAAAST